jgi:DNA-binding NarL/FixJ family response regulator
VLAPGPKFNVSMQNIDIFMWAKEVAALFSYNRLPVTPSTIATAQSDGCAALQQGTSIIGCRSAALQCPNPEAFRAASMPMQLTRILLVDDDDIVREALNIRLARENHLKIVGSVATGEEALIAAARLKPDLIILDLWLPGLSGMDTMRSIFKSLPQVRIVVLSTRQSPEQIQQAFERGASGYVFKPSSGTDLLEAVQAVIAGQQYASPVFRRSLTSVGGAHAESPGTTFPASKAS